MRAGHWGIAAWLLCVASGCAGRGPSTFDQGALIRGDRTRPEIALIFTGGEHGDGTRAILAALAERDIPAAFFLTGGYLAQPEYRELVRGMLAAGHYVGPHSHAHLLYCAWEDRGQTLVTRAEFDADLQRNIAELRELGALPAGQPVLFVPPSQWYNAEQVAWAAAQGVTLINFTPGSGSNRDWIPEGHPRFVSARQIRADVLAYEAAQPDGLNGFLLLLHVGSLRQDKMHLQVGPLIDALRGRGYRFVRIDRTDWWR